MTEGRYLLLYDSDCRVCVSLGNWVRRIDFEGHVESAPLTSCKALAFLKDVDGSLRSASMHVVLPDGGRASAGLALLMLMEALPHLSGLAWLLSGRDSGRKAAERLYSSLVWLRGRLAPRE